MKRMTFAAFLATGIILAFWVTGCGKASSPAAPEAGPMQELEALLAPPALPAPESGEICAIIDLEQCELARIERETELLKERPKGLTDGTYNFDAEIDITRNMAGKVIFDNTYARAEIVSGGLTFKPGFHWDAYISGGVLRNTQAYIQNTATGNAAYKVTVKGSYTNTYAKNLYYWSQTYFSLIGGWVPAWVTFNIQIDGGAYFNAQAYCWMQQGVSVSSYVRVGAKWVNGSGWSNIAYHSPSATATTPVYSWNGSLTIQPYLNAFVSAYLYSVLGPRLLVTPYLTLYLNAPSRYIDTWARLRGHIYFDLKGLEQYTIWDKQLFLWTHQFARRYF
jgi:hypothetical protein